MNKNILKNRLIDFRIYNSKGNSLLGTADVTLPDFEFMSDTFKGAGIAGEVDIPTLGQYSSLTLGLSWNSINTDLTELSTPGSHDLEIRGAQQGYNKDTGDIEVDEIVINTRVLTKKTGLGKLEKSSSTDSSYEAEIVSFKLTLNGTTVIDMDKMSYKLEINGTDYLSAVSSALGL